MVGAALECVHCYSLVHDDLPAMDDDDLRRGRPTAHKAFDEASAILAGDGLLTFAFDVLARPETHPDPAVRAELILALARAAGLGGMAGGQMLDLAAEGRFADGKPQRLNEAEVEMLQAMKTGALLRFACVAGGILGKAGVAERVALDRYGAAIGQRSRSPTTSSMSRATAPRSARLPARTPRPARRRWSRSSGRTGRRSGSGPWWWRPRRRLRRSARRRPILKEAARFVADRKA